MKQFLMKPESSKILVLCLSSWLQCPQQANCRVEGAHACDSPTISMRSKHKQAQTCVLEDF
eukprot:scaffold253657_cov18-Tisochrysis_lutea.AAC.1